MQVELSIVTISKYDNINVGEHIRGLTNNQLNSVKCPCNLYMHLNISAMPRNTDMICRMFFR